MTYDIAIVGGGVIGWSIAWHLAKKCPSLRIVVIDPHEELQTSRRGAGIFRVAFDDAEFRSWSLQSGRFFENFEREVGPKLTFVKRGGLTCTVDRAKAIELEEVASSLASAGANPILLDKRALRDAYPYFETRDLILGLLCPEEALLNGNELVRGLSTASVEAGVSILTDGVVELGDGMMSLRSGVSLRAERIVVACGHWLCTLVPELPVRPERRQVFLHPHVAAMPADAPFVFDGDTGFHFRKRGEGILAGYRDPGLAQSPCDFDREPHFDVSVFFRMRPQIKHRAPQIFSSWSDIKGWSGYIAETPDQCPILGIWRGLFIACGFGERGIMHSPAIGALAAESLLGSPDVVPKRFLPDRFEQPQPAAGSSTI